MEKEVFKALTSGLGLAGKLVGRSVDEAVKAVKGGEDGVALCETALYHVPQPASTALSPRVRWNETQTSSRLNSNVLKDLTMSAGEKEFRLGLGHLLAGRYSNAVETLRDASKRSESKIQVTDAYFVLGSLLLQEGQTEEAARHLRTALMAQQGLGRGLKRWCPTFHISLALTDFSAFALGPDLIGLTVALALAQFHHEPAEAVHTLDQLLELVPNEPSALFFASLLRFRLDRDREVFQLLQKILPDSNLHIADMLLLGLSVARLGDSATARELFKKALQMKDLDHTLGNDMRVALAHCARLAGAHAEAETELQAVLRKTPGYVSFETRWGLHLHGAPTADAAEAVASATPAPVVSAPPSPSPAPGPAAQPASDLPVASAGPVSLIDSAGSASRLVASEKNLDVALSGAPFIIGREADVSLVGDSAASRQHAKVTYADGDYWIEDLGSTNGTWVNRHRIRRRVELHRGDVVEIGEHRFEVR